MYTIRRSARPVSAPPLPITAKRLSESESLAEWDADIVRASRAAASRSDHADDIAQNARLAVLLAIREKRITHERYIRRVISNSIKNSLRQTRVVLGAVPDDGLEELPCPAFAGDVIATARVTAWIQTQRPEYRNVFELIYQEDLTQRQAADCLGVSQPRVAQLHRQLLARGADQLRDLTT